MLFVAVLEGVLVGTTVELSRSFESPVVGIFVGPHVQKLWCMCWFVERLFAEE